MATVEEVDYSGEDMEDIVCPMKAMTLREFSNQTWRCNVPEGTSRLNLIVPKFYSELQLKLRPFDKVQFVSSDFWAEVLIVEAGTDVMIQAIELWFVPIKR